MAFRLGIDIGGTFTDFALFDETGGNFAIHKQLTTPDDPSRAVLQGAAELLARQDLDLASVVEIVHGTTLVANAVIERKGARTGMLTTRGFRDILDMGREKRYDVFDLRLKFPDPLVPRRRRAEVEERCRYDGIGGDNAGLTSAIGNSFRTDSQNKPIWGDEYPGNRSKATPHTTSLTGG